MATWRRIILSRFAWLSLGCIGLLAVVMNFTLSSLLSRAVSRWEWDNTATFIQHEVKRARLAPLFAAPPTPETRQRWASSIPDMLLGLPEIVRIKVWNLEATVIWSDDGRSIGQRFPDNPQLRASISGQVDVSLKSTIKAENQHERSTFTTLAEIYVPIFSADGRVLGVVEVYKTPERLIATIRQARIAIWTISSAGALLLFLVMYPLLTLVYRKKVEEETLRAETGRLKAEVAKNTEQLFQAQKMEAVGLLAGGIAHDFNNLLTVITGRAQLLSRGVTADSSLARGLGLIENTAERAATLTRQLLAFSRKQVLQQRVLDLNAIVADMEKMLRPLIGEDTSLTAVLDPAVGLVSADPGQLEQVILNLALNARDAMPNGGRIVLTTANVQVDEATAARQPGLHAGRYSVFAVRDTGVGMDLATQARLFEPFFTTKEPGKGTGLGLSTVYGIVKQHGGFVSVESAPGMGTTFTIHLPTVEAALEAAEALPQPAPAARGSETVVVVEDEDEVRALATEILRERGYTVLAAADGHEALRLAAEHPGPLDLLLTDVVMPLVNGWELARRFSAVHPETKVLYMTGYTEIAVVHEDVPSAAVLQKPFTPDALARTVRDVIQAVKVTV